MSPLVDTEVGVANILNLLHTYVLILIGRLCLRCVREKLKKNLRNLCFLRKR